VPPRVLVDATAVPADRGGVGRYVDDLLAALVAEGADLAIACQRADAERYGRLTGATAPTVVPGPAAISSRPARLAWEQTGLPLVARQVGAEVVHSPHYTMPLRTGRPVVVTLHDATFFTDAGVHSRVKGTFFRSATRAALRRAARCVVPSRATRDELVRVLGADPDGIDVAYHGVDAEVFHVPDDGERARAASRLGLDGAGYVAFLGTLEPRKNVPALVEGWVRACQDREEPPALVLAGASGWDDRIEAAVAAVPPHLRVLSPGYLSLSDLRGYLGGALVVAYPSLGEGFGLPVLEAMACGAPVLTTTRLALPEVGGDAVAYTEPDPSAVGAALAALLDDPERRARLAAAGRERAAGFTWQRCAQQHLESYERAAGGG
jgi:glycosyltransferase involved in cell wall biosynthesis